MTAQEEKELINRVQAAEVATQVLVKHIGRIEEALCQLRGAVENQLAVQRRILAAAGTSQHQLDLLFDHKLREPAIAIARHEIGLTDQIPPSSGSLPDQYQN